MICCNSSTALTQQVKVALKTTALVYSNGHRPWDPITAQTLGDTLGIPLGARKAQEEGLELSADMYLTK